MKPALILSRQREGSGSLLQLSDNSEGKKHVIEAFLSVVGFCFVLVFFSVILLFFNCLSVLTIL